MSQIAFPFLTLGDDSVAATDWIVSDADQPLDVRHGWIEDWDYARDITLERQIRVDFDLAASQLQLPADELELALVLRIATGAGSMPRLVRTWQTHVLRRDASEMVLTQTVAGHTLSARLRVECQLLLKSEPEKPAPLSPTMPRARLWADRLDLRLEGEEPRFPMELMSFAERFPGRPETHAPWYLHWLPGNHERDFGGAVRLYINSDRQDFVERVLQGDRATIQVMFADVMQQVVGDYLDHHGSELISPEAEEGSIAAQAQFWIGLAFPGQHPSQVRAMLKQRPGSYHAALLAAADVAAEQSA